MSGLEEIRSGIDAVDVHLVALLAEREQLVRRAGRLKGDPAAVPAPDRVEQVVAKARALAAEHGADADVVERTYRAMITAFIDLELTETDRG
ncbi:chorismate mutase [Nocardioides anomalus]|uniref:Chorismate mutase n=1 Tax=Nocardioides anomalus TaxID=2712223 RepID=A0A6G6WB58_9ACTN|nr:chorismate mutase [Nocardioides anomalus]QIG42270.1 chorismate mutase [Nocardioides anomalus]